MNEKKNFTGRYLLIDAMRGFAITNMVIFHFLYDVYMIYGKDTSWYALPYIHVWQQAICWTFILIAGLVWHLGGTNNFRRGIFFNICGLAISLITWVIIPAEAIRFGILNFMGCAVLLTIPLHNIIHKIPSIVGIIVNFTAFILFKNIQRGYLGIGEVKLWTLPTTLYNIKILTPFGFPYPGFRSSDYFPIFPWIFLFFTGYFFYFIFEKHDLWKHIAYAKIPILSKFGGKTIWIYLAHQPICMLVCAVLFH